MKSTLVGTRRFMFESISPATALIKRSQRFYIIQIPTALASKNIEVMANTCPKRKSKPTFPTKIDATSRLKPSADLQIKPLSR